MSFVPKDQAIRDRVLDAHVNQVIKASAGSGKTTLIVEKFMRLLDQDVPATSIAAITFTKQAAMELKNRIARAYQKKYPDRPPLYTDGLSITTIHGFCKSLIDPMALTFGFLPGFDVNQDHIQERVEQAYQNHLPSLVKKHADFWIWKMFGFVRLSHIYTWLAQLDLQNMQLRIDPPLQLDWSWQAQLDQWPGVLTTCQDENDRLFQSMHTWQKRLSQMQPDQPHTWATLFEEKLPKVSRTGNQKNWGSKENLERARMLMEETFAAFETFRSASAQRLLYELSTLQHEMHAVRMKEKQKEQYLEPDDLLTFTRDLLRVEETWGVMSRQYRYLFVDEFQDTDPLQTEILFRLLATEFQENLKDIQLKPASLTVVGDPQQSIYRFRHASLPTFLQAQETIQTQGGATYDITQNFRSHASIVDFVNARFAHMKHFEPMTPKEESQTQNVKVMEAPSHIDSSKMRLPELRELEALILREGVSQLLAANPVLTPSDVVVLMPTFSHADVLEKIWQPHLPIVKARKSNVIDPFFHHVMDVIHALEEPEHPLHTMRMSRTPFFYTALADLEQATLPDIFSTWQNMYKRSAYVAFEHIHAHTTQVLDESTHRLERQIMDFCLEHVLRFDMQEKHNTEMDLVTYLTDRFEKSFVPFVEDLDAVRIMTIHQSKGLEFPVVVMAGLYQQASSSPSMWMDVSSQQTHLRLAPFSSWCTTPDFKTHLDHEKKAALEEKRRLLYVAATRAQSHLVTTRFHLMSKSKTYADLLWSEPQNADPRMT